MKKSLYWINFLLLILACTPNTWITPTTRPTPTPLISSRTLGTTDNFPWRERWRFVRNRGVIYQNVRDLITTEDGVIFTDGPRLKFVDANNGDLKWTVELEGMIDSITSDESLVYIVGNPRQGIAAYSLQTGELAWKSNITLPGHAGFYLNLQGKMLYVYEAMDLIYIIDTETGNLINKFHVPSIGQEPSALLQLENKNMLQSDRNQLMLTKDEQIIWQTNLGGYPQKFPEIYDGMLFVRFDNDTSSFDNLARLNLETGDIIWQSKGEYLSNFMIVEDMLYVISKEAKILILDPLTGLIVGSAQLLPNNINTFYPYSAIAVNESMLYVYFYDSQELIAFERVIE